MYSFFQKLNPFNRAAKQTQPALKNDEAKSLEFYRHIIHEQDTVYDIGANIGNRTAIFQQLANQVIAVEPQPDCAEKLRAYARHHRNVTCIQTALGATESKANMWVSNHNTLSTLSTEWTRLSSSEKRFPNSTWEQTLEVQVTTLDTLIKEHGEPGFIKIDVEGYELEVLKGLSIPVKHIAIEFVPENLDLAMQCLDTIGQIDTYKFQYSSGESMQWYFDDWVDRHAINSLLRSYPVEELEFGDIYAQRVSSKEPNAQ